MILLIIGDTDLLQEDFEMSPCSAGKFETLMSCLGLTERKPVPEPVAFSEPNPLGDNFLGDKEKSGDIMSSLSKF